MLAESRRREPKVETQPLLRRLILARLVVALELLLRIRVGGLLEEVLQIDLRRMTRDEAVDLLQQLARRIHDAVLDPAQREPERSFRQRRRLRGALRADLPLLQ